MKVRQETKAIKEGLSKAGYAQVHVTHPCYNYPNWLDIAVSVSEPFSHKGRAYHHSRVGEIAQSVTGEHGDPVRQMTILVHFEKGGD